MQQNFLNNFPSEIQETVSKLYDTILERSLMEAYQKLDDTQKSMMATIFNTDDEKKKKNFLKEYVGDLQDIMVKETKKIIEEIKKQPAN
jgi:TRAP-type C4-dicarboxylate transport system substrate-binding protein